MAIKHLILFIIINGFLNITCHEVKNTSNKRPRIDLTPSTSPDLNSNTCPVEIPKLELNPGLKIDPSAALTPQSPQSSTPFKSPQLAANSKRKTPKLSPITIPRATTQLSINPIHKEDCEVLNETSIFLNTALQLINETDTVARTCSHASYKLSIVRQAIPVSTKEKTKQELLRESNPYRSTTRKDYHFVVKINKALESLLNQFSLKK